MTLTFDLLTLNFTALRVSYTETPYTKFERNRIVNGWVTDDLARFRRAILGNCGTTDRQAVLRRHRPNFTKFAEAIRRSSQRNFVSEFGYLAAFSNAGGSNLSDSQVMLKTTLNFALFDPPVKIRGGWARSVDQLLKLYLRPNLRNAINCAANERGLLAKKRKFMVKA